MSRILPRMIDMAKTQQELTDSSMPYPMGSQSVYPYGLCICLGNDELEKLDLDSDDVGVGDMIHLFCLAKVTSVSKNQTTEGQSTRIELQITHIAEESEDEENEEMLRSRPARLSYR